MLQYSIHRIDRIENDILRERLEAGRNRRCHCFVTRYGELDAGLLIFEECARLRLGIVYEVYVLKEFRGKQIGQRLLSHAETIAKSLSLENLQLRVRSLDPKHMDDQGLLAWYMRNGYAPDLDDQTLLRKVVD